MLDSPETVHDNNKQMPPVTFDKIHNHNRNYNLYHPTLHEEVDQPLRKTSVPPLKITRHHTEDEQIPINSHAVNQTIQPHYNHELLYPPEELETNVIESYRGQSYEEESGKNRSKVTKFTFFQKILTPLAQ